MSVNLNKNRESILSAYKDVLDDKTSTNWALYGYEGQTNDLKLIEKGDGGITELTDEVNSGKIMYAFISIKDPKTDLTKFCLINWQGEGAPTLRKGSCANHIHDVKKLLNGSHLTINARVEEDIDEDLILNKLKHVSSAYNFNQRHTTTTDDDDKRKKPVGTVYKRCIPENEINSMERDKFWQREEEEERKRKEFDNERKQLELLKVEEERRAREEREHNERERIAVKAAAAAASAAATSLAISPQSPQYESPHSPISSPTAITNELLNSPNRSVTQAELWREQRKQEAKELIGSRVGTAKAIFSQNSSSGQMQNKTSAPIKPVRSSKSQGNNSLNNSENDDNDLISSKHNDRLFNDEQSEYLQQKEFEEEEERLRKLEEKQQQFTIDNQEQEEQQQYSTIKRSPHNKSLEQDVTTPPSSTQSPQISPTAVTPPSVATVTSSPPPPTTTTATTSILKNNNNSSKNQLIDDLINRKNDNESNNVQVDDTYQEFLTEDMGLKARALYDYQAADESEITFDPGDIITHIDQIDEGWWQGLGPDGTYGLFPANYVDIIP